MALKNTSEALFNRNQILDSFEQAQNTGNKEDVYKRQVLGFLSRYSLFRITIDSEKCNQCSLCSRNCKACLLYTSLQTYREKGLLPFSRIRHKIFYKPEDVGKLLQSSHYPNTAAL